MLNLLGAGNPASSKRPFFVLVLLVLLFLAGLFRFSAAPEEPPLKRPPSVPPPPKRAMIRTMISGRPPLPPLLVPEPLPPEPGALLPLPTGPVPRPSPQISFPVPFPVTFLFLPLGLFSAIAHFLSLLQPVGETGHRPAALFLPCHPGSLPCRQNTPIISIAYFISVVDTIPRRDQRSVRLHQNTMLRLSQNR